MSEETDETAMTSDDTATRAVARVCGLKAVLSATLHERWRVETNEDLTG